MQLSEKERELIGKLEKIEADIRAFIKDAVKTHDAILPSEVHMK